MNPSKSGLSSAAKTGIVVVVVVLVLGGAYLAPSLSKGGSSSSTQTTSFQSEASCSSPAGGGNQTVGLLTLFGCFSQMQLQTNTVDNQEVGGGPIRNQISVSYLVLGKGTLNSTQYTKVEFSEAGVGNSHVVAWFNPRGGIDRVDTLGNGRNYTGPGAPFFAQIYVSTFGSIPAITNNATLLSMLSKTSENTTSVGPTQLDVTTYHLVVPTPPYKGITAEYTTVPGTNVRLAIYLDEKTTNGSETTVQITSVTR